MPFPTPLLDQIQAQRRHQFEQERLATLIKAWDWLRDNALCYGIHQAYLVGSLVRPYQFTPRSDVDVAVEQIDPDYFFPAMAHLSEYLERDVDIIELSKCHFADRLRREGIPWTVVN